MEDRSAATGFTSTQLGAEEPENHEILFNAREFPVGAQLHEVKVSLGLTINLGNYESARIDVGVRSPCLADEIPETYEKIKSWCEQRIGKEVKEIRGKR